MVYNWIKSIQWSCTATYANVAKDTFIHKISLNQFGYRCMSG